VKLEVIPLGCEDYKPIVTNQYSSELRARHWSSSHLKPDKLHDKAVYQEILGMYKIHMLTLVGNHNIQK
jgi:hypothetical protein